MKKLALGALFVGLTACGGGSNSTVSLIDAPSGGDGGGMTCNPLTQTGCNTGEKCTWISDQDNPPIGHVGCAPEGGVGGTPIALGGACTDPVAGPMGYDDCAKGTVCLSGECKQICDVNGGAPACDENNACTRYADFFESGGTAVAGVCDPACDPLTQELKIGTNKAGCGSPNPAMPSKGCFGYDEYSCAPSGMTSWPLTDRMMPRTNPAGNPYLNGCAPGFIPLFFEMTGSTRTLCTGICAALEISNAQPAGNADGDDTALGKAPTAAGPVAGGATCALTARGSGPAVGSQCRFLWPYLEDDATGELPIAFERDYVDKIGVCMSISFFDYDSNADMMPDMDYPNCANLVPTGAANMFDNAAFWGCLKRSNTPMALTSSGKKAQLSPALQNVRVPKQVEMELVRHSLD
ncbi:MAG: hypothetical protein ACKV2T_27870 [Kofleriaceae bacterium]